MNKVIITKCIECANWCPATSLGTGTYCDELQRIISGGDVEIDIPDICPKLASQCINAADERKPGEFKVEFKTSKLKRWKPKNIIPHR